MNQILTGLGLFFITFFAQANIKAVGLMPGMAILEQDGQRIVIKAGEEKQGIRLVRADSEQCLIIVDGQRQTLLLGASLASGYVAPQSKEVRLAQQFGGHYYANAKMNGRTIKMLVDTGASHVTLSGNVARRMGIEYANGRRGVSSTASGRVPSYMVQVNDITVEGIKRYNVWVNVIEGGHPEVPLLGMSFLGQLKIQQDNGELVLSE
ncbi:MAG: TIGR02281 family clan AA aspartic protease [Gammaproteobacteria bacterium]|nr:TIGR02281 family clan AA aspartic protease [Gammaproteobacteria bacterium]